MTDELDEILINLKDALELAREEDTPRDMEIRFMLTLAVNKLEAHIQDDFGYQYNISSF
jgi:hypothetical protein|tara:strand:+ start:598 stop:774 length:177 start_codon:yes stop_codon:yes gene_type:complete